MRYPKEVKEIIDNTLSRYEVNESLKDFDIFHLYDVGLAYPTGYYDSRFFRLVGYNTATMQVRELGKHDGIIYEDGVRIKITRIFADGATLIGFDGFVTVVETQCIMVYPK